MLKRSQVRGVQRAVLRQAVKTHYPRSQLWRLKVLRASEEDGVRRVTFEAETLSTTSGQLVLPARQRRGGAAAPYIYKGIAAADAVSSVLGVTGAVKTIAKECLKRCGRAIGRALGYGGGGRLSARAAEDARHARLNDELGGVAKEGGVADEVIAAGALSTGQLANLARYSRKLPSRAGEPQILRQADGSVRLLGRCPGSSPRLICPLYQERQSLRADNRVHEGDIRLRR